MTWVLLGDGIMMMFYIFVCVFYSVLFLLVIRIRYRKQTALNQESGSYSVCLFKQPKPGFLKLESPGGCC